MKSPIIFRVFKNNQIFFVKQFIDKDQLIIGSSQDSGAEVDIDLDSQEISPIHCLVEKRGLQYYLCDLGSTQGTYKNGQLVLDEPLKAGDEFQVGPFKIVFFVGIPKPVHTQSSELVISDKSESKAASKAAVVIPPPPTSQISSTSYVSQATPPPAPVVNVQEVEAPLLSKPKIAAEFIGQRLNKSTTQYGRRVKGQKTFAPRSEFSTLQEVLKPGQGGVVEVVVSWKERILNTFHFSQMGNYEAGASQPIQLPEGSVPKGWSLLSCTSAGVTIQLNSEMKTEVHRADNILIVKEASYRLQQNEVVFIELLNGMSLAIRFAPKTHVIPLDSPLILTASEFTGILASLIFAVLLSLIVSVLSPKLNQEEEVQRVAQVIFNKPPVEIKTPPPVVKPPPPPPQQAVEQPKPPEEKPVKITEATKTVERKEKGDPQKPEQRSQSAQSAGRASEVKPKDSKLKTKMFTSTKQGGAIKTGAVAGANAQSKDPDPTNSGLLAAFGSGGARSTLDKAYSGSGEALGAGEKATGSSGFNTNRAGNDLGSQFKDTGAGGKGTATVGIAGVGTKGLGSGMGTAGNGTGFGSKDRVEIKGGGAEEEFIGSIDKEAVRRAIRDSYSAFKACFEREYKKDSRLEGKVVIAFEIHEKGIARNAKVEKNKSSINNSAVEECVRARMLTIRFPEPPTGAIAEIVFPFVFRGQQ